MTKKNTEIGAWELYKELQSDPEWVIQNDRIESEISLKKERYLEQEFPLRDELRRIGFEIKWVWDFVNSRENYYLDAIPTLIDHLQRPYSDEIREGIVRSLALKEARGLAGPAIIGVLCETGLSDQLRWALANTLTVVADRSNRDAIKALLETEANNDVADRLARALKTATKP